MKPFKVERDLQYISTNSPSQQELGGADVRKLLSLGLVRQVRNTKVSYHKPKDAPIWATKYKFTRKKYGVTESTDINERYMLTSKGKRRLRSLRCLRLKKDREDKEDSH